MRAPPQSGGPGSRTDRIHRDAPVARRINWRATNLRHPTIGPCMAPGSAPLVGVVPTGGSDRAARPRVGVRFEAQVRPIPPADEHVSVTTARRVLPVLASSGSPLRAAASQLAHGISTKDEALLVKTFNQLQNECGQLGWPTGHVMSKRKTCQRPDQQEGHE
jgi:hypothetical protein